jgi:hypothetical protein
MANRKEQYVLGLEKKVRELKQEVRTLHKRLSRLTKGYKAYLDSEPLDDDYIKETKIDKNADKQCWNCDIGKLKVVIIGNRRFRKCNNCDNRTKVKIIT